MGEDAYTSNRSELDEPRYDVTRAELARIADALERIAELIDITTAPERLSRLPGLISGRHD